MTMPFSVKLRICYGVLFPKSIFSYRKENKNQHIFNEGYKTGLVDARLPGLYKVTTNEYLTGVLTDYLVDDLDEAQDIIDKFYEDSTHKGDSCDFVQTFIDRDLSYLLK